MWWPFGYDDTKLMLKVDMVQASLGRIEAALTKQAKETTTMAKTLDDVLADQQTALTKITAIETVEDSIAALVASQKQTLADLQAQLAEAIAAGDPAKVQQVADNMAAINAALDAEAAKQAVITNTPAG